MTIKRDEEEQVMMMENGGLMMRPCLMDRERQDRVKSMKHDLMLASIHDEQENVEESEWVSSMQELRLD